MNFWRSVRCLFRSRGWYIDDCRLLMVVIAIMVVITVIAVVVIIVVVVVMIMMVMMIIVIEVMMALRVCMSDLIPTLDYWLLSNYLGGDRQLLLDYHWLGNYERLLLHVHVRRCLLIHSIDYSLRLVVI